MESNNQEEKKPLKVRLFPHAEFSLCSHSPSRFAVLALRRVGHGTIVLLPTENLSATI